MDIKYVHSAQDIENSLSDSKKNVLLYGTCVPRQNIDILYAIYKKIQHKYNVLFVVRQNAIRSMTNAQDMDLDTVYVLDDPNILCACDRIDLLLTNDYVLFGENLLRFKGYVAILHHNINAPQPNFHNFFADYLFTSNKDNQIAIEYKLIPNQLKIRKNPYLTIIPLPYPKLFLLHEEKNKLKYKENPNFISYFPVPLYCSCGTDKEKTRRLFSATKEFITCFLQTFPKHVFVFRPAADEKDASFYKDIESLFKDHDNFIMDYTDDNKYYLVRSQFLITDYSAVEKNFCYLAYKPIIRFRPLESESADMVRDTFGYIVHSVKAIFDAIQDAIKTAQEWEQHLQSLASDYYSPEVNTFDVLSNSIERILNNSPIPSSARYDKFDTPCNSIGEFLRLCNIMRKHEFYTSSDPHILLKWTNLAFGNDLKKNLAMFVLLLDARREVVHGSFRFVTLSIDICIKKLLSNLPVRYTIAVLLQKIKKNPDDLYLLRVLYIVATRNGILSFWPVTILYLRFNHVSVSKLLSAFKLLHRIKRNKDEVMQAP